MVKEYQSTLLKKMKISLIVAMASNRVIGLDNKMPWHLSADLKKFKSITMGSPILMGRKTYESIGKPLPGRTTLIISRNPDYQQEGCLVFNDLNTALKKACESTEEIFIIGGSDLYKATLPLADSIYLTLINSDFQGDTFFPEIDLNAWSEVTREDIKDDPDVNFSYSFLKLEKTNQNACQQKLTKKR
jgi:dihydrofolate reductase